MAPYSRLALVNTVSVDGTHAIGEEPHGENCAEDTHKKTKRRVYG